MHRTVKLPKVLEVKERARVPDTMPALVGLEFHPTPPGRPKRWVLFVTGRIASSAKGRHLSYSDGHFEVFRPTGATRCTAGAKFGPSVHTSMPNFTRTGLGPQH